MIEPPLVFREWLNSQGATEAYIRNNGGRIIYRALPLLYFENFHWDSTPEGYEYWANLDYKWSDMCEVFEKRTKTPIHFGFTNREIPNAK